MATKRKRSSEPKKIAACDARAAKPERRPTPRKRADAVYESRKRTDAVYESRKRTDAVYESRKRTDAVYDPCESEKKPVEPEKKPRKPKKHRRRWPFVAAGVVAAILVAVVSVFSWDRWLRYDDAAEFQGAWQAHGSTAVVVIDDTNINLTSDVAYSYALDTKAKTISFTFGNMEGAGRYRFSLDRSRLVITDGDGYSWFSTLVDDIGWMAAQAVDALQGRMADEVPATDGVTVLDRLSRDTTASPGDVSE